MSDFEEMKQRQARVWGLGDYDVLAPQLSSPAATALCDACAVSAGQEVLDVGAGHRQLRDRLRARGRERGRVRLWRRAWSSAGRARTEAEGFDVEWVEADVEDAALRGRPLRLRRLGLRRLHRAAARGGGRRDVPRRAPGQHGGPDGVDAGRLLRRPASALGQRYVPHAGRAAARPQEWGDEATARARLEGARLARGDRARHAHLHRRTRRRRSRRMVDSAPPLRRRARRTCRRSSSRSWFASTRGADARAWNDADDGGVRVEVGVPDRSSRASAGSAADRQAAARVRRLGLRGLGAPAGAAHRAGRARGGARDGAARARWS